MSALTIELPDSVLAANSMNREEAASEVRLLLAAKWFEMGRVSAGQAAELAGLARAEFMFAISRLGVSPIQVDPEDMAAEFGGG